MTPRNKKKFTISIVTTIYNEQEVLADFFSELTNILDKLKQNYEIIAVDDGSQDNSTTLLIEHHKNNNKIKIIQLSRNFGKDIALTAGLERATGDIVIPIDADLQDPPHLIPKMIDIWQQGYDVVYATRKSRKGESIIKRTSASLFYKLFNKMSDTTIPKNTGDFRLIDKKVLNAINNLTERARFMKGLFSWVGFSQTSIEFIRPARKYSTTKWNYSKLWNYGLDGIISFSSIPLKIWSYFGICFAGISFLYGTFTIIKTCVFGIDVPGYASLLVATLFIGGTILIGIGIIGEYLSRIYNEIKQRPIYIKNQEIGFKK